MRSFHPVLSANPQAFQASLWTSLLQMYAKVREILIEKKTRILVL